MIFPKFTFNGKEYTWEEAEKKGIPFPDNPPLPQKIERRINLDAQQCVGLGLQINGVILSTLIEILKTLPNQSSKYKVTINEIKEVEK